jgi:hypothetical protein
VETFDEEGGMSLVFQRVDQDMTDDLVSQYKDASGATTNDAKSKVQLMADALQTADIQS